MNKFFYGLVSLSLIGFNGCSSSSSTASSSPSSVISQFDKAMSSAGSNLQSSSGLTALHTNMSAATSVSDFCDDHAQPIDNMGNRMNNSDPEYPARIFYCKIAKNTGDEETVRGAYTFLKEISCALDNAGVTFDGVEHSATITVDKTCFSAEQLSKDEIPGSLKIKYTASQPAAFNKNFDSGVVMTVPEFGSFSLATRVDGNKIEFMGYEDQSDLHPHKTGGYVGQFDSDTGEIRFEAMQDRYHCEDGDSCSFGRHDKIYLACDSVDASGNCTGVKEVQGAASNIYHQTGTYGEIATISGKFADGVRSRLYTDGTETFNTPADYTEVPNTLCFTADSSTAGDCTGNAGIELPSSTFHFSLFEGFTPVSTWHETVGDLKFTSVSLED
jgi:hypothetical protein